ncbi:MAG: MFS transporter [Bryobacteraceae bacterium]
MTTPRKPTHARYWVIVFAVALAVITYIDRVCISQAAPSIRHDLGLTPVQMGYAFAAFSWAYALFEIPGGWLGDWLGPRRVLMRVVLWWSFFTAATGWVRGLISLVATQFLFGAGEAGCFPNLTKAFTTWLPQRERVRAQGIMWMSARWGGAFTPLLVEWAIRHMSWRHAFGAFGALGVLWAAAFYPWFRDNPRDHKGVNAEELAALEGAEKLAAGHGHVPWKKLVRSRTAWMLWAQYFCLSYSWCFFITWLPTYLKEYRHLDAHYAAQLAVFPLLLGGLGCAIGGFLSPLAARWTGSVAVARRRMAYLGFVGASLLLVAHTGIRNPLWAMVVMGLAGFANDLTIPGAWGACMDVGGKFAGTLSGSMNMLGNLGSGIAPIVFGYVIQATKSCLPNFYIMAAVYLLGALCWRFIDPVTPLEET